MKVTSLKSVWIPAAQPSKRLIVVLHGRGDSPAGFQWLPSALGFTDVNYLLVQAPDRYYTGYSWYDVPPNQGPGILRSRESLERLFEELEGQGYPSETTILFGFSQGCLMTLEWGGRTLRSLAGFIGISGYCYDPVALKKDLSAVAKRSRWLITHGTLDAVLAYEVTRKHVEELKAAGLPLEFHTFVKEHTIDDRDELPLLRTWMKGAWS
ncbi:MAG: serine esterase [Chitinophagaceae bacterium]|nr:serine esterase [Oligoflexus sp.]